MTALEKQNMVKNSLQRLCKHTDCEDCEFFNPDDKTDGFLWCAIRDKDRKPPSYKTWDMESAMGEVAKEHNNGWIPLGKGLPACGKYILLSFENFSVPQVGRYEEDENGEGKFYIGDEEKSCMSQDLFVNAWQPLPEVYREKGENYVL